MRVSDFVPPVLVRVLRKLMVHGTPAPVVSPYDAVPVHLYYHPMLGSYSQFAEDLLIDLLLQGRAGMGGIYVDVGANDPSVLSNTRRLRNKGWRGINIEPTLRLFEKLQAERADDVNLAVGLGEKTGSATFYEMSHDTLSTFDKAEAIRGDYNSRIVAQRLVQIRTLTSVLDEYLADRQIDLLSVDVEGGNLAVLRGNDWTRHRPLLLIIEVTLPERQLTVPFVQAQDYVRIYDNTLNIIFADASRLNEIT